MSETTQTEAAKFKKTTDGRGRELQGIWQRRGLFYASIRFDGRAKLVPLLDETGERVTTVRQAVIARAAVLADREKGVTPAPRITPILRDYAEKYITYLEATTAKSPLTIRHEQGSLNGWVEQYGDLRINAITRTHINDYAVYCADKKKVSNRTINLAVLALRHLLTHAKGEGWLKQLPTDDFKELRYLAPKRTLIADDTVDRLCAEAVSKKPDGAPKHENGQLFSDFFRLLSLTGARKLACLRVKWSSVDFGNRQISFPASKFDKTVTVDFSDKLEAHLLDMKARKSESPWLFPSPYKTGLDTCMENPSKTFEALRAAIGMPELHLHDFRHAFISHAVMDGVDILTVARWSGHSDGGVLIGKVYGHLSNEHAQASAKKLTHGSRTLTTQSPAPSQPAPAPASSSSLSTSELLAELQRRAAAGN